MHLPLLLLVADWLREYLVCVSADQSHGLQVVVERVSVWSQLDRVYCDLYAEVLLGVL